MRARGNTTGKLANAIIWFAEHDSTAGLEKMMKLLYFLDFRNYAETGFSVTGLDYTARKRGPVPVGLREDLCRKKSDTYGISKFVRYENGRGFVPLVEFSDRDFTGIELESLNSVLEDFRGMKFNAISEITHRKGTPWSRTKLGNEISYDLVLDGLDAEKAESVRECADYWDSLKRAFGDAVR